MRYVAVMETDGAGTSRPVLSTPEPAIVREVLDLLAKRLGELDPDAKVEAFFLKGPEGEGHEH